MEKRKITRSTFYHYCKEKAEITMHDYDIFKESLPSFLFQCI